MTAALAGFRRTDGSVGARDHLLVLPSVVCATQLARELDGDDVVAITHQHGCLHVGDDLVHTEAAFVAAATNPNVGAVLVMSLGCETLGGSRLARQIRDAGQTVRLVGIQSAGGTRRALATAREAVESLRAKLRAHERSPAAAPELVLGVDGDGPLARALRAAAAERSLRTVVSSRAGGEAHVELAGRGAQVIVSLRPPGHGPIGFAVCPVVAVACDAELYAALRDDFDLEGTDRDPAAVAEAILDEAAAVFNGRRTASEERGARDFILRRIAVTM